MNWLRQSRLPRTHTHFLLLCVIRAARLINRCKELWTKMKIRKIGSMWRVCVCGMACRVHDFCFEKNKNCFFELFFEIFSLRFGGIVITQSHTRNYRLCFFEGNMHMSSDFRFRWQFMFVDRLVHGHSELIFICDFSARERDGIFKIHFGITCLSVRQLIAACRCWRTSRMRNQSRATICFWITSVPHTSDTALSSQFSSVQAHVQLQFIYI